MIITTIYPIVTGKIVVNPVSSLPKVLNPKKVEHIPMRFDDKLPSFYNNIQSSSGGDIGVGSEAGI